MAGLKRAFDMIQAEMDEKDNIIEKQRMKIEQFELSPPPPPSALVIIGERLRMAASFEDARTILNSLDIEGGPIRLEDIQNPMCHIQLKWSIHDKRWELDNVGFCTSIYAFVSSRICGVCDAHENGASFSIQEVK